jgi:hypothetical protein
MALGSSTQPQETKVLWKGDSEAEFQERVRHVIHELYSAAQNSTISRDGRVSFEDVFVFLLEIIGSVIGLSWGIYSTLVAAVPPPPQ